MSLNLTQITQEAVSHCRVNTISSIRGTLSYATACIDINTQNATLVQCYNIPTSINSTCESILNEDVNINIKLECFNFCQVTIPATNIGSATPQPFSSELISATSSVEIPTRPGFSTNPPFSIATYILSPPNTAISLYPNFIIISFLFIILFLKNVS